MAQPSIIGHEKERLFLERLLKPGSEGRTLHLTGASRLGKKTCALQYALQLRGEGEKEKELVLRGDHPDITLFSPEGKVALHSAEAVRGVIERCREPPYAGPYRILILDGAERMQGVSSNTLLKTLEEPLKSTFIFLISERKERILPTILSRAIEVSFSPIPQELLLRELKGEGKMDRKLAIDLAKGSFSRAQEFFLEGLPIWRSPLLELLSEEEGKTYFVFREGIKQMLEPVTALKEGDSLRYFETVNEIFSSVVGWYRDLHLLRERGPHRSLYFPDQRQLLEEQLEKGNIPSLRKVLDAVEEAYRAVDRSNSLQTTFESLLLQLFR